jgi:hypothetical protein
MRPPGHLTSAEYAERIGVAKSRVSEYVKRGMPAVEGSDDHGRICKFINPETADWWRSNNLGVKVEGATGRIRGGAVDLPQRAPPARDPQGDPAGGQTGRRSSARHPPRRSSASTRSPLTGDAEDSAALVASRESASRRIQAAKISQEEDKALTARLRRMQVQGKLLDRKAFMDVFEGFVAQTAVSIERMPQDLATKVADRLGLEEHPVYLALRDLVVERLRSDLATYAEQQRDRLPPGEEPPEDDASSADLFGDFDEEVDL